MTTSTHPPTHWYTVTVPIVTHATVDVAATSEEAAVTIAQLKIRETTTHPRVMFGMTIELDPVSSQLAPYADITDHTTHTNYEIFFDDEGDVSTIHKEDDQP